MRSSAAQHLALLRYAWRARQARPFTLHTQLCMIWLPIMLLASSRADAGELAATAMEEQRLQKLVNDLRGRLSVQHDIVVALVPKNPLMASVEPIKDRKGAFLLSIDHGFLVQLSDEELTAVLAHELGHVWIFTHHPYLHTESLANRIAMRVVSRESLEKVYGKVWQHEPIKGGLARYLGDPPPERVAEATRVASPR